MKMHRMSQQIEALKLALEALEWADCNDDDGYEDKKQKALMAIYQALADADAFTCRMRVGQDSVTWYDEKGNETMHVDSSNKVTVTKHESTNEPVAWFHTETQQVFVNEPPKILKRQCEPLYTRPQDQKKDEALRLALEALKNLYNDTELLVTRSQHKFMKQAITLIEQALENK